MICDFWDQGASILYTYVGGFSAVSSGTVIEYRGRYGFTGIPQILTGTTTRKEAFIQMHPSAGPGT